MKIHLVFDVPDSNAEAVKSNLGSTPGIRQMAADWLVHETPFKAFEEVEFEARGEPLNVDPPVLEEIEAS